MGTVKMLVRLGHFFSLLEFISCENLAASSILVTDNCDRFVDSIRPRTYFFVPYDGSTVPIVRRPLKSQSSIPLPKALEPL